MFDKVVEKVGKEQIVKAVDEYRIKDKLKIAGLCAGAFAAGYLVAEIKENNEFRRTCSDFMMRHNRQDSESK